MERTTRKIDLYIRRAEELTKKEGGIESLEGAIANTERLRDKGEPVSERNLEVLRKLHKLAKRAGKSPDQN